MAHKVLVDGTAYEISGGRTLVNGTGYSIDKGKTLVGGTAYEVGFGVPCTVTIVAFGISPNGNANVTLNGQTYSAKGVSVSNDQNNPTKLAEITVPSGTVMSCSACTSLGNSKGTIVLNGTNVAEAASAGVTATYDYVVNGNIIVELNDATVVVSNLSVSRVLITEIPEGHALVKIKQTSYYLEDTYVSIDGVRYQKSATCVVPIGTVIYCYTKAGNKEDKGSVSITLNGQEVSTVTQLGMGTFLGEYYYTVTRQAKIEMAYDEYDQTSIITITEQ